MMSWLTAATPVSSLMKIDDVYLVPDGQIDQFLTFVTPTTINTNQDVKYRSIPGSGKATVLLRETIKKINPSEDFQVAVKITKNHLTEINLPAKLMGQFIDQTASGKFSDSATITKLLMTGHEHALDLNNDRVMLLKNTLVFTSFEVKDILARLAVATSKVVCTRNSSYFTFNGEGIMWTITVSMSEIFATKMKDLTTPWYHVTFSE